MNAVIRGKRHFTRSYVWKFDAAKVLLQNGADVNAVELQHECVPICMRMGECCPPLLVR